MTNIDYAFTLEIYVRYARHLESIEKSILTNLAFYEKNRSELLRLVQFKPERYKQSLKEVERKIQEADIKLSHISPRLNKITEQITLISQEHNVPIWGQETKEKEHLI